MLSHIVNLVSGYETDNGNRPNLVYMNETHDIALSEVAVRPHVATVRYTEENILVS
jgi:hypothetical protein